MTPANLQSTTVLLLYIYSNLCLYYDVHGFKQEIKTTRCRQNTHTHTHTDALRDRTSQTDTSYLVALTKIKNKKGHTPTHTHTHICTRQQRAAPLTDKAPHVHRLYDTVLQTPARTHSFAACGAYEYKARRQRSPRTEPTRLLCSARGAAITPTLHCLLNESNRGVSGASQRTTPKKKKKKTSPRPFVSN